MKIPALHPDHRQATIILVVAIALFLVTVILAAAEVISWSAGFSVFGLIGLILSIYTLVRLYKDSQRPK